MDEKLNDVRNRYQQNYEYISNDPEENADNFDPKWASFRELSTDVERYQAIRKRWGNADIPDPQINLTCRQSKKNFNSKAEVQKNDKTENILPTDEPNKKRISRRRSRSCSRWEEKENCEPSTEIWPLADKNKRNRQVSRRRSRSCTRPYERLISDLERNYTAEYSQLLCRQNAELQGMLQFHFQRLACRSIFNFGHNFATNLKIQQEKEVINLLANHYKQVNKLFGEKRENIEACIRYIEEVKAFFNFYQKMNDTEITVQMTDAQYQHTVETERMYAAYSNFYK